MDANLVNPFIEATLNVLETTASTKAVAGKPFLKRDPVALGSITGVLLLAGEKNASVSLSFSENSILSIVSNMFGETMNELNEEIKDAVGEISNMISGQVTNAIAQTGERYKVTLRQVILENKHSVPHIGKYPAVALPFTTDKGDFTIEVCFEK
jgi:chemotaxis protein CheX